MVEKRMSSFVYMNPTKIIFGDNQIEKLPSLIPNESKILLLSGEKSAEESGVLSRIRDELLEYEVFEFKGIRANPEVSILNQAVKLVN
ncbi:iron-containing alcohol dehydrogenase, partial [Weizmannia acidilactici]|uniref:iron-containing alcohol dehydrogenase n=1 Tax=Weizmannia acidilactici TaxID=2607726 RepID=UPI00124C83DE